MDVLLTRVAYDRFQHVIRSPHVECEWICVENDGTLTSGEGRQLRTTPNATVAWASTDVLYSPSSSTFFASVAQMNALQWFQSSFAGVDHPAYRPLLQRGVIVTTSHANSVSIAEYVLGAVLRAFQRPGEWRVAQERCEWRHHEFREIFGTTWLIIGLGAIGTEVARRASAFGAKVVGVRRGPDGTEPVDRVLRPAEMLDAVTESDVIVLSLTAGRDTRHLVDAGFLSRVRDNSVLVNVARGSLLNVPDLLVALDAGRPSVAILDVFEEEPLPPSSPLWSHSGVILTPHASSGGLGRHLRNAELFRRNFDAFVLGGKLENVLTMAQLEVGGNGADVPAQFRT